MMKKTISLVLVLISAMVTEATKADFTFGTPANLGPNINSSPYPFDPSISADGIELFFEQRPLGVGQGDADIYVSRRASKDDPWGPCMNIGAPVNTAYWDQAPSISPDGLSLYFSSYNRPGGYGSDDLWVTTRKTKDAPWEEPVNLGATVNNSAADWLPSISSDSLVLFFMSDRPGGLGWNDLWFTSRATKNDAWGSPVNLGATTNSSYYESAPDISADGLSLFFQSDRPGGFGSLDIWMAARPFKGAPWTTPVNLGPPVNTSGWNYAPNISADGRTLYFCSSRPGGYSAYGNIWQAPIIPIVDFNGDKKVDIQDLLRLIESWGKDDPSVDMGPMPWGDGKVDVNDLQVLMRYWQQEILPPELAAYWKLDEAEGSVAHDSVEDIHGTLYGQPLWQPDGGKKAGGLQFDGVDDYVSTAFVLDPSAGPFSVFAWIQGGTPGQAIISQTDGPNGTGETWLGTDTLEGKLMTGLRPPGQRGPTPPMVSNAVITNGEWHHVGLVVSGHEAQARELYADGRRVAFDSQPGRLPSSGGGLYFGADNALGAASFFSGLIDDVRIYDVALSADKIEALAQ